MATVTNYKLTVDTEFECLITHDHDQWYMRVQHAQWFGYTAYGCGMPA